MRLKNTWQEIRDHSFIQNHSRPFRFSAPWRCFFSSVHLTHVLQGSGQRTPDTRSETILSSRITPDPLDSQLHDGASSLQFTSLMFYRVQVRGHLTRDQRPFFHPESLQTLQIHSFFSSVHLTHLLQGSDQRTPDKRSETIPSSRITPDLQIHSFSSSVHLTHVLQGSGQRTPDTRSEIIPSSRITPDLQIHIFFSSVHLTHVLQGSGQRTPDKRSETILSSRITPDPSDSQLLLFSSPHSCSTGFRSEDTWQEIRDHSFIQNHSRSSDSQLLLFSSPHSSSTGFRSENTWQEIRDHSFIQNHSRPFRFTASSLQFTSLMFYRVQIREHLTRDQRPFLHPESLQIFRFTASSLQFTSLIFYRVQIREHLTRDQRPFLHPESLQIFRFTASSLQFTSLIFYRVQIRGHLTRDQRPFFHPESLQTLQIHSFFSSVHLTHVLQGSGQRTPDTRSETIPSSRITPDLQIHSFFSSVHLTHVLQGSDQRTPDTRSETILSSRITPDPSDSQLLLFSSPHSCSTGFRSENTWHEIRDHSFIQNHSRSFRFTASSLQFTSLIFYRVQIREHLTRDQRPFLHPESLQIFRFTASSLQFTSLMFYRVQIRGHLTRDQRPFFHPESLQTLQIHSFFSSVHLTHVLQGSGQRTPDTRSETILSSRITPDPSDSQLLLFSSLHSCSTGFRSEDTWHEIRDHSFIQNHSRSSDSQLLLFSSPHSCSTGFRSENTWQEIRDHSFIQNHSRPFRFTASSLQFTSLMFYRVQVREHLTRDQRPFLHPESLQTLQIHSFFSSVHLTHLLQGSDQRTGTARAEAWFCAQWPIFGLFLRFVFGLLYSWKIQTWSIIRFLTESVTCWFYICWYLIESMMPCV